VPIPRTPRSGPEVAPPTATEWQRWFTVTATLLCGDSLAVMRTLPDGVARCCVTSPPYFGLRSYDEDALRVDPALSADELGWLIAELERRGIRARE